jgi:predicted component of type VI protein secretion system
MPLLILLYNNEELHTYPVEKNHILTIGRSDQNNIIIDETAVSSVHAEIEFEAGSYYITDIQSKNGTFVDGELVISRKLKNGNIISVGNYSLRFQDEDTENQREASDSVSQATMMLDTSIHRSKLAKSLAEISEEKESIKTQAMLTFLDGSRDSIAIDKQLITIGKENTCDVKIKGLFIGNASAELLQKDEAYYVKPATKKSKVKLNYKTIKTETVLKNFDVIEVGSKKMQFHIKML